MPRVLRTTMHCVLLILWCLFLPASSGAADSMLPRPGAEIFESCRLCHSTKEMQRGPILNGLPTWYVTQQLAKFREGVRGTNAENRSEFLMGSANGLVRDSEEIRRVAEFIAALPPTNHLRSVRGDEGRGKTLYLTCVPCHGEKGEGKPELKSPPLNVQEDWYLLEQLGKYKSGQRGSDPRDLEAKIMQLAIGHLLNKDFRDLVHYIATRLARTNGVSQYPITPPPN